MDAYDEAMALMDNLPASGPISWDLGKVYNALLAAAKEAQPNSVSLGVMEPLESGGTYVKGPQAHDVKAMLAIVATAVDPGPSV